MRWDPFVLRAQPLDMSPLSLCWHNKMLLPANLPQSHIFQLANSWNISWGLIIQTAEMMSYHLPCHQGTPPQIARRRWHQVPMDTFIQSGIHPSGELGWRPRMHNGTQWGAGTSKGRGAPIIRLIRTRVHIQACPRRQKGRLITSQWDTLVTPFFRVNHVSQFWGAVWKYCAVWEYMKMWAERSPAAKWVRSSLPLCLCLAIW
jgi:hypothetical protein